MTRQDRTLPGQELSNHSDAGGRERRGHAVDVSGEMKRKGEGNALDVITQISCCRREEGLWRLFWKTSKASWQTKQ